MTDGIIQKTIRHWIGNKVFPNGVTMTEITAHDIMILQKQLILDVRRTLEENYPTLDFSMIIGDYQE